MMVSVGGGDSRMGGAVIISVIVTWGPRRLLPISASGGVNKPCEQSSLLASRCLPSLPLSPPSIAF